MVIRLSLILMLAILTLENCSKKVTFRSLVEEMTNRESLTRFPPKEFFHKQFSSYNRASVSPDAKGWFENQDMSHFIRVETNGGRREFVLLDSEGPGAIVRWWMTFFKAQNGILRIYLDNQPLPQISGSPSDLLSGKLLAGYPFSASVQKGAELGEAGRDYDYNLYLPLPFSSHCKVTYQCDSLKLLYDYEGNHIPEGFYSPDVFYNIGCRLYIKGTRVKSVSQTEIENLKPVTSHAGDLLLSGISLSSEKRKLEDVISPGDSFSVVISRRNSAICLLSLSLTANDVSQALRSTVIKVSFDGKETIWTPVGEFFGAGYMPYPHKTWMNERDVNGLMKSYWMMPFRDSCIITFVNFGKEKVTINGEAGLIQYKWTPQSMYFGSSWHEYYNIGTRDEKGSPFDLNFINIRGRGVYAGDQITLFNNTYYWWGEGDEKIFVDGEAFPSVFGTGTEDYYGYSFGRQEPFSHPFISQPIGTGNMNWGVTVNMRHRSLDAIPFTSSISSNIELWHWASVNINYAMTSYYYVFPGFSINIKPDIKGVKRQVILTKEDFSTKVN